MSSKHIIIVVKRQSRRRLWPFRSLYHPSFPSIGIGGERTFPGKQSSLTHKGGSPPPSEGGSEGLLMAQERGFQFRQESCNKFWRRIASFRHPLRHRPLRSPFLRRGNTGNASASKRSSTKRRCSGFLSFFLSILSSLLQRQRASAFLPSDASVTTCTYCCSCGRGWVGGPSVRGKCGVSLFFLV